MKCFREILPKKAKKISPKGKREGIKERRESDGGKDIKILTVQIRYVKMLG